MTMFGGQLNLLGMLIFRVYYLLKHATRFIQQNQDVTRAVCVMYAGII